MSAKGMAATNAWQGGTTFGVTPTGSPFTYENVSQTAQTVMVSGGTVLTIAVSRDGTNFILAGLLGGQYVLIPGDDLRITYLVAPTLTVIPL